MTLNQYKPIRLIAELLRYGMVSGVALVVDFCTLLLLAEHMHYLLAASLSFVLGGLVAYYLSIKYVFGQRKLNNMAGELSLFIGLGLVGLALNAAIISVAVGQCAWPLATAKMLAAGGTFTCNFTLRKWLLFTQPALLQTT
jgi:putative flippase GtrA